MSESSPFLECGLTQTEEKVLTYLLRSGPRAASVVAKSLRIKRPTVYAALGELKGLGLVTVNKRDRRSIYATISPSLIPRVLEAHALSRFQKVQHSTKLIARAMEDIERTQSQSVVQYSVEDFSEKEAAFLEHFKFSVGGSFRAIFNPNIAVNDHTRRAVQDFLRETGKRRIALDEVAVAGDETDWYLAQIDNPNHQVRLIDENFPFSSNVIMRDGIVAVTHYGERELSTIRINHPQFYESMNSIFEYFWSTLGEESGVF